MVDANSAIDGFICLTFARHRIAVKQRCCISRSTRCIDQNSRDGAAVCTAAINSQQHQDSRGRFHAVGQRDTEDTAEVRGQTGNRTDHDAERQADRNDKKMLPVQKKMQSL